MSTQSFHHTDMRMSSICLGTANYGSRMPQNDAFSQMDRYRDRGGNAIDTAAIYADWMSDEKSISEKTIGKWFQARKNRDQVILSTKGGHPPLEDSSISRVWVPELEGDLEQSLKNLQTDYIDLYFLHRDNLAIGVEELLDWLEAKVKEGKIRYYGCSNWTLVRIQEAQAVAESQNITGFVCNQVLMTLAKTAEDYVEKTQMLTITPDMLRYHQQSGLGLMAYRAGAMGYYTKLKQHLPISKEMAWLFGSETNQAIFQKLAELETDEIRIPDMLYHYVIDQPFPSVAVASFSSDNQLIQAMGSMDKQMDSRAMAELAAILNAPEKNGVHA